MPLNYQNPSNNTVASDEPIFQDWASAEKHIYKSINVPGVPENEIIQIPVKDIVGSYPQATTLRMSYMKEYLPSGIQWIKAFTYKDTGVPDVSIINFLQITENGLVLEFPMELQNINLLSSGIYKYRQTFSLQASINGSWVEISYIFHDTYLHIVEDLVLFSPKSMSFNHIVGTVPESKEIMLNGNAWSLVGKYRYILFSEDPGVIIENVTDSQGTYQIASGSGEKTVMVTLTNFFDQPAVPGNLPIVFYMDQLAVRSDGTHVGYLTTRVRKFFTQVLSLSPAELTFQAIKNVNDPAPQDIIFECNVAYIITHSPWITLSVQNKLVDGVPEQVINVWPMSTHNLEAGVYVGYVTVTATINGVEKSVTTIIRYTVDDLLGNPYEYGKLAFTLDNKFLSILSFNQETYIQMTTVVKTYDFFTDNEKEHTIPEKIGLFQGKARVNIGKRIHQLMNRSRQINDNVFQYQPAKVSLSLIEKSFSDDSTIRIFDTEEISFLAGLSNNFSNFGFLKFNHLPERVTTSEYKFLNIVVGQEEHFLVTYKNGIEFSRELLLLSTGHILTKKILFDQFNQGDKIEVSIVTGNLESSKLIFIIFPEGKYKNQLIWEDEFLLKDTMECTGTFSLKSDLSFLSQNTYQDLVEQLEYLDSTKVAKITINTGWILKTQVDSIESLMRSKRIWLELSGKRVSLVPISTSLPNEESERELFDYPLEFQINQKYNEETYRF